MRGAYLLSIRIPHEYNGRPCFIWGILASYDFKLFLYDAPRSYI